MTSIDGIPNTSQVQARWRAREAPSGDFVMFADGSLTVMELVRFSSHNGPDSYLWRELLRATAWTPDDWMDIDSTHDSCTYLGSRALSGESANHGSMGWVALTRDDDDSTLEWVAVSCSSNPFSKVTLDATSVTATSTAGQIWTFPRNAPQQVRITDDPTYGLQR
ncbi:hypothetical protein F4556_006707 [Kitasatospora gansuensis]|uniref:Uncharacterized protein n=1 Tax=Kitasatospora gansuensis TaxID=258050 RepID=A0A7W7SJB2_9ACTN|nr:hypothetical protein [Kitasatospora gansuensis]MBB4951172.1 hypothetical protein [Kitasatospora gansuensis]